MNTNEILNSSSTETPVTSSMLNRKVLPPLSFGEHQAKLVSYTEAKAKNGNNYLSASFLFDNEVTPRSKAIFEVEFNIMLAGIGAQLNVYGDAATVLEAAKTTPIKITVEQSTDETTGKSYVNWYYRN